MSQHKQTKKKNEMKNEMKIVLFCLFLHNNKLSDEIDIYHKNPSRPISYHQITLFIVS